MRDCDGGNSRLMKTATILIALKLVAVDAPMIVAVVAKTTETNPYQPHRDTQYRNAN